jgi:2-amino-4-hydroxy-6-hydroxymethyldihydropteridine diphosphokinase
MGNREQMLSQAADELEKRAGQILRKSSIIETPAWGNTQQPDFLNQVLELETELAPATLMQVILQTELDMGRKRTEKWGPRTIDIDILLYDNLVLNEPGLKIPHEHLHEREFVLKPLCELVPNMLHPELELSMQHLLQNLQA